MRKTIAIYSAVLIISLCSLIFSCNSIPIKYINPEEFTESESSLLLLIVKDTISSVENLKINTTVIGFNGCSEFSKYSYEENKDTLAFKFYIKEKNGSVCTAALIEIPKELEIVTQKKGLLFLKYKNENNKYVFDSTFVK